MGTASSMHTDETVHQSQEIYFYISGAIWIVFTGILGKAFWELYSKMLYPQYLILGFLAAGNLFRCLWFFIYPGHARSIDRIYAEVELTRLSMMSQFSAISLLVLVWSRSLRVSSNSGGRAKCFLGKRDIEDAGQPTNSADPRPSSSSDGRPNAHSGDVVKSPLTEGGGDQNSPDPDPAPAPAPGRVEASGAVRLSSALSARRQNHRLGPQLGGGDGGQAGDSSDADAIKFRRRVWLLVNVAVWVSGIVIAAHPLDHTLLAMYNLTVSLLCIMLAAAMLYLGFKNFERVRDDYEVMVAGMAASRNSAGGDGDVESGIAAPLSKLQQQIAELTVFTFLWKGTNSLLLESSPNAAAAGGNKVNKSSRSLTKDAESTRLEKAIHLRADALHTVLRVSATVAGFYFLQALVFLHESLPGRHSTTFHSILFVQVFVAYQLEIIVALVLAHALSPANSFLRRRVLLEFDCWSDNLARRSRFWKTICCCSVAIAMAKRGAKAENDTPSAAKGRKDGSAAEAAAQMDRKQAFAQQKKVNTARGALAEDPAGDPDTSLCMEWFNTFWCCICFAFCFLKKLIKKKKKKNKKGAHAKNGEGVGESGQNVDGDSEVAAPDADDESIVQRPEHKRITAYVTGSDSEKDDDDEEEEEEEEEDPDIDFDPEAGAGGSKVRAVQMRTMVGARTAAKDESASANPMVTGTSVNASADASASASAQPPAEDSSSSANA